jgi:macrolide transport system ATP-binding/permease protein
MDTIWQDVRYAVRTLVNAPAFTIAAIVSLAIGIGANTTIFTLLNTLFLNPLPVARPSELVAVLTVASKNATQFGNLLPLSYPNLEDFRARNSVLTDLAGYSPPLPLSLTTEQEPQRVFAQLVTGNYFDVLGIRPAAGRFFSPDEDRTPGTHPVAVIGYGLWQRRYGGRPDAIGLTIALNRRTFTIVGVAPEGFKGVTSMFGPELWLPSMMSAEMQPRQSGSWLDERAAVVFSTAGRLKPGVTIARAEANFKTIAQALEHEYPEPNAGRSVTVMPLAEATIFPGMRGMLMLAGGVLMTIVGLVLLIACSNVANLLLARATARRQEIAMRIALGATRGRLIRQLVTESLVLGTAGGALGLLLGIWGRDLLWSALPATVLNNFVELKIDAHVLVFTLILSLVSASVFGLVPALRASRADLVGALKLEPLFAAGRRRLSLANGLVVGQVALSLVALITAALFLRSLQRAHTVDLGYRTGPVAVVSVNLAQGGYDEVRGRQFARDVRDRVKLVPGISAVSWSTNLPLWANLYRRISIEGREPARQADAPLAVVATVDLDYFTVLGLGVTRGRDFTDADRERALPVAIVNERMAERYWPNQDPIGRTFRFDSEAAARLVVGVVKTIKYQTLGETPQPAVYLPFRQNYADGLVLYVRTAGDPSHAIGTVQRELRAMDPHVPLENAASVDDVIDQSLWMMKIAAGLLAVFGGLALALASVGLYGLVAYSVNQRRRELGVRMALGAGRGDVLRLVLRDGMALVLVGIAGGVGLSLLVSRALAALLLGVNGTDPVSVAGASLLLAAVAFIGSYLPARRASTFDLQSILR